MNDRDQDNIFCYTLMLRCNIFFQRPLTIRRRRSKILHNMKIESQEKKKDEKIVQAFKKVSGAEAKKQAKEEADLIKANRKFIKKMLKDGVKTDALEIKKNRAIIRNAFRKGRIKTK